jgi:hypothetical protein
MSAHEHLPAMMRVRVVRNRIRINNVTRGSAVNVKQLAFTYQLPDFTPVASRFQVIVDGRYYLRAQVLRQAQNAFVCGHIQYFAYEFWCERYRNVVVRVEHRTRHAQTNRYRLIGVSMDVVRIRHRNGLF